jgi:VIT1/CCC1 family predicted Fe2+/Mn2+ transporter
MFGATPEPESWIETFKGALTEACCVVLVTAMFLGHSPSWVVLCWIACSLALAIAVALAHKRKQPEDCKAVTRLTTAVLVVMLFVFLVTLK